MRWKQNRLHLGRCESVPRSTHQSGEGKVPSSATVLSHQIFENFVGHCGRCLEDRTTGPPWQLCHCRLTVSEETDDAVCQKLIHAELTHSTDTKSFYWGKQTETYIHSTLATARVLTPRECHTYYDETIHQFESTTAVALR